MSATRNPRSVYVIFRLTPTERKELREEAAAKGVTMSNLIRQKVGLR